MQKMILFMTCCIISVLFIFSVLAYGKNAREQFTGLRALADGKGIIFGAAVSAYQLTNIPDIAIITNEFNCVVAGNETKWSFLEPDSNTFTYAQADAILNFALSNGLWMRGHTLLWHSDYQIPQWIKKLDHNQLETAERNHISNIITHFKDKIYCWDVANEIIMDRGNGFRNRNGSESDYSIWSENPNDDSIIRSAFYQARQTADSLGIKIKLFLNDYNIERMGSPKTEKFFETVSNWIKEGVPIDGVGFQCHFLEDFTPNYDGIRRNIDRFQALGLEVQITEMDVRIAFPVKPENLLSQASIYGNMMKIAADKKLKTFIIWGVSDKDSWIMSTFPGYGSPLIFDENFSNKPAYESLKQVLSE